MAPGVGNADLIDLRFDGEERTVGVYLIDWEGELTLVDCGPASTIPTLQGRLAELSLMLRDLRHIILTHIHLDHAGAAGTLVRENPKLRIHVSEVGAPHLIDPSRLARSARRLYGESFDGLFGELVPIPAENVEVVGSRVCGLECFPTPGHAAHHVSYMDDRGTLFAGDALGLALAPTRVVVPATPPPEVDLESWHRTLDEIERRSPDTLALPHYGFVLEPEQHVSRFRRQLMLNAEQVRSGLEMVEFVIGERARIEQVAPDDVERYNLAGNLEFSWQGLRRYWDKQAEAEAETAEAGAT